MVRGKTERQSTLERRRELRGGEKHRLGEEVQRRQTLKGATTVYFFLNISDKGERILLDRIQARGRGWEICGRRGGE